MRAANGAGLLSSDPHGLGSLASTNAQLRDVEEVIEDHHTTHLAGID
jgi:hypothetical protein